MRIYLKDSLGSIHKSDVDIDPEDMDLAAEITRQYPEARNVNLTANNKIISFNPIHIIAMWIE